MGSIPMESDRDFKDSDWTMDDDPSIKDIYSEAQCRVEASYMARGDVDLKIADWIGLPSWLDLRPGVACLRRHQGRIDEKHPCGSGIRVSSDPDHRLPSMGARHIERQ